jgi:translation initiation factor 5B
MPPKKNKGKKTQDDDEDWEALLAEEAELNGASAAKAAAEAQAAAEAAAVAEKEEMNDEEEGNNASDKKKKKKKPKKKGEEKEKPLTAAGAAILERQRLKAEEEARVKALMEEEEARIKAEEEAEERAAEAAAEEKERKRLAREKKVAEQKAAGTYMTKAEKAKAKANAERLEAMKAAGMKIGTGSTSTSAEGSGSSGGSGSGGGGGGGKSKMIVPNKKKQPNKYAEELAAKKKAEEEAAAAKKKEEEEAAKKASDEAEGAKASEINVDVADDWDNSDDDWEANLDDLANKVGSMAAKHDMDNCEDELELQKKAEQERLKQSGLVRAKKAEEERLRKEAEDAAAAEEERQAREARLKKENSRKRRIQRDIDAKAARTPDNLRSPIAVIMGHVDTGKTKLLDNIRSTNVQEGEAGGITQQIGATQFSPDLLKSKTAPMKGVAGFNDIRLPGLLMIDTPGHESFSNLRSRGSSLCDIAILVIDLMHGLEPQTIESLNMLRKGKTPFVVALNKVDRCYGWKSNVNAPIRDTLAAQDANTRSEFMDRAQKSMTQLNEQGLNCALYWENDSPEDTISLVPTSAHTGEGVPDLLSMLIKGTQDMQTEKIMYHTSLQCTVLEVKNIDGYGATCDVVLVNGVLREGDRIVISTMDGPIETTVKALLTPPPNKEMRVKNEYLHHKELAGAIGVKIVAADIGKAIAGTPVLCIEGDDDAEDVKEDCQSDLTAITKALETDAKGVIVHASTLGAMEALLQFLRNECKPAIPVSHISIGTVFKKDVMRARLMHDKGMPEFATILGFDVKVDTDAQTMADEDNVRIFTADIIYHLFDQFTSYMAGITAERKEAAQAVVQFPCILKIMPQHVFNKKDPIVLGVEVLEGNVRIGTKLCIPSLDNLLVGEVVNIQNNHRDVTIGKKGMSVAIKISNDSNPTLMYGRQFDHNYSLYSMLSRQSIDACKEFFKDEMSKEDWQLVVKLKKVFNIT